MTDNNTIIALFTAATLALTSPRARAQPRDAPIPPDEPSSRSPRSAPFGTQGQWVLGLEDLFLIRHTAMEAEYEGTQDDVTTSQRMTWDETAVQTFWPSVAADFFPVSALSVGLSARYVFKQTKNAGDVRLESNGETQVMNQRGTSSTHELTLSPRVGYSFSLSDELALAGPAVEKDLFGDAAGPSSPSDMSDRLATVVSFGIGAAARL